MHAYASILLIPVNQFSYTYRERSLVWTFINMTKKLIRLEGFCKCVTLSLRYSWPLCHLIPLDSFSLSLIFSCRIVRTFTFRCSSFTSFARSLFCQFGVQATGVQGPICKFYRLFSLLQLAPFMQSNVSFVMNLYFFVCYVVIALVSSGGSFQL